jgi:hypothetical protein
LRCAFSAFALRALRDPLGIFRYRHACGRSRRPLSVAGPSRDCDIASFALPAFAL